MAFLRITFIPLIGILFLFSSFTGNAQDTIKVMHYNLLHYGNFPPSYCDSIDNDPVKKEQYMKTIINYVKPDIVAVNEMGRNEMYHQRLLDNAFNHEWRNYYAKADCPNQAYSYVVNQLYYDSRKFELHSQYVTQTTIRDIDLYRLYYRSPDLPDIDTAFIDVITAHLKAGSDNYDLEDRAKMTSNTMQYLNSQNVSPNLLFTGDLNTRSSSEEGFQNLINHSNPSIRFNDPIDKLGNWNNNSYYTDIHTQSTHAASGDCASGGGMDDRYDFILANSAVMNGDDHYHYLEASYKAIGQDGEHFNKSIWYPENISVPENVMDALYYMSDHLPVVIELVIDQQGAGIARNKLLNASITYNNPARDWLNLSMTLEEKQNLTLMIHGANGQLMMKEPLGKHTFRISKRIDISGLDHGFYIMTLSNGEQSLWKKLLVY